MCRILAKSRVGRNYFVDVQRKIDTLLRDFSIKRQLNQENYHNGFVFPAVF